MGLRGSTRGWVWAWLPWPSLGPSHWLRAQPFPTGFKACHLRCLPWRLPRQDPLTPAPETVLSYKGEASRGQSWDWNLDCPTSDPPLFHSTHPLQPISTPPPAPSRSLPCLSHPWCQVFITSRPNCLMPSHVSACKPVSPASSALTTGQAELMK